jgi:DNA-binding FadR family transcriptional regulator
VHRTMALMATTSLAATGRGEIAQDEHRRLVAAIAARDGETAAQAIREHISVAFMTRLKRDAIKREKSG